MDRPERAEAERLLRASTCEPFDENLHVFSGVQGLFVCANHVEATTAIDTVGRERAAAVFRTRPPNETLSITTASALRMRMFQIEA